MATSTTDLQDALRLGLSVVSELWNRKAKNWVTSVCAADIDNDGDIEIIAGSRDGRICVLTKRGDDKWERIVGRKEWVGTVACLPDIEGRETAARIIAGARDGRIYAFDKEGKTAGPDGQTYPFGKNGRAVDGKKEPAALWHRCGQVIRQIVVTPENRPVVIVGSEDRGVYALDAQTGELCWSFCTNGWVRAVFACDIDNDGQIEILVGSGDHHLYILNSDGHCIGKKNIGRQIYTLFATDVDQDGVVEILLGTDGKDLLALTPALEEKWCRTFDNRLLTLYVSDLDKDGQNEIIAGSEDKHLYFLDQQGNVIWRHNVGYRVFSVYAIDYDNDGLIEVLAGSEDTRVHAFRVQLIKDLDKRIRRCYQALRKPALANLTELPLAEHALLCDILKEDITQHTMLKRVTLKHIEHLLEKKEYTQALSDLLDLEQQKVQVLWRKDTVGHVRTLCFGDISGDLKREIIVGTAEGNIQAFNTASRSLWSLHLSRQHLGGKILAVQSGYVDHGKWEEIIACSSDHHLYLVSGVSHISGTRQIRALPHVKRDPYIDEWMSSIYVSAPDRQGPVEIIVGTEDKKLRFYDGKLDAPYKTIHTPQGIKIVCAHEPAPHEENVPEIIAGSIENTVYAYRRSGDLLWTYKTQDRVRAICIKDIDGDGKIEIVIGSEDRNVHVLDSAGHLKWRHYTPHRVLAVEVADIDHDGKMEILLGCGDGYLYVLSRDGDLLWKYRSNDRVRVVVVEDIDDDDDVEIAVGSEDQLEMLQVVNQQQVRKLIQHCWTALQQEQPVAVIIESLLKHSDAALRAFALSKYAEQGPDFAVLESFIKDSSVEVRKVLLRVVMTRYATNPQGARQLLTQLSMDTDQEVRQTFIESLHLLMRSDWELGFEYLERFSRNIDRFVRRSVTRKLHQLIDIPHEKSKDRMFDLLLMVAQDEESEWIRQEAARTLAHFLDSHPGDLLLRLYTFIVKGISHAVLKQIVHNATTPSVQHLFSAIVPLLTGLNEDNVLERVEQAVKAFDETQSLRLGTDTWLIYNEVYRLVNACTIDEIARYQCTLDQKQFAPDNEHALTILRICDHFSTITRVLKLYLRRDSLNDRLSSLLEAINNINVMHKFVEREYSAPLLGEPMLFLPDRQIFNILLKRWRNIVEVQLSELRGKVELKVELQTKNARHEEQVGVLLVVSNRGRSSANNVKVSLLQKSDDFDVLGKNSLETEVIFFKEEKEFEFVISPHVNALDLVFEVVYDDAEAQMKDFLFGDRLELQTSDQDFRYIPNPYSTGTPTQESHMFYGREADIEFLKDNLTRTAAKTVIILYGQRRSGKTTLLLHLVNAPVLDAHIPVLIDMQRVSYGITASKFLYTIASSIFQALKKKGIIVRQPESKDFATDPTFAFDTFLDDVEANLNEQRIILLIDEFEVLEEQVAKKSWNQKFFSICAV